MKYARVSLNAKNMSMIFTNTNLTRMWWCMQNVMALKCDVFYVKIAFVQCKVDIFIIINLHKCWISNTYNTVSLKCNLRKKYKRKFLRSLLNTSDVIHEWKIDFYSYTDYRQCLLHHYEVYYKRWKSSEFYIIPLFCVCVFF